MSCRIMMYFPINRHNCGNFEGRVKCKEKRDFGTFFHLWDEFMEIIFSSTCTRHAYFSVLELDPTARLQKNFWPLDMPHGF